MCCWVVKLDDGVGCVDMCLYYSCVWVLDEVVGVVVVG